MYLFVSIFLIDKERVHLKTVKEITKEKLV